MKQKDAKIAGEIITASKDIMSAQDITLEFGIPDQFIKRYCKIHNIKLLSPLEINIAYIRKMADLKSPAKIAKALDIEVSYVKSLAKQHGIQLLITNRNATKLAIPEKPLIKKEEIVPVIIKSKVSKSAPFKIRLSEQARDYVKSLLSLEENKPKRIKEPLTQGSSPYGLAVEVHGVNIK